MPRPPQLLRRILLSVGMLGPLAVVMAAGAPHRGESAMGPGRLAIARLQYDVLAPPHPDAK